MSQNPIKLFRIKFLSKFDLLLWEGWFDIFRTLSFLNREKTFFALFIRARGGGLVPKSIRRHRASCKKRKIAKTRNWTSGQNAEKKVFWVNHFFHRHGQLGSIEGCQKFKIICVWQKANNSILSHRSWWKN